MVRPMKSRTSSRRLHRKITGKAGFAGLAFSLLSLGPATAAETFTNTGSLSGARIVHSATLLPNGTVLVAGGQGLGSSSTAISEIYDPATGFWATTFSL